ncbi:hypothetical protein [Nocardia sp. NPDC052112]|uniref:hypothetical protein n=1 Tax=Nocardia sp. NPDC052112 TaxID=3155646 RepID=UPI0034137387
MAVFERARREGFLLTMHCDIDQEGSIEHIRQALEDIGVDRIDHGTDIVEDERLVELAKAKGIGFTCCPVSNSFVTEQMKSSEIRTLLDRGLAVTVNSDDPPTSAPMRPTTICHSPPTRTSISTVSSNSPRTRSAPPG